MDNSAAEKAEAERLAAEKARQERLAAEQEAQREVPQSIKQSEPGQVESKPANTPVRVQGAVADLVDRIVINFDYNKTKPKYDSETEANLRSLCNAMQNDANLRVSVIGHTDNVGTKRNNKMGRKRANAVRSLMVGMGAPVDNIDVVTRGGKEPKESNRTKDGRAHNRRVTLEQK